MENSSHFFKDLLNNLQGCLKEFNCASDIKISEQDAILYGKISHDGERYTIVVHLKEENYIPRTSGVGKSIMPEDTAQKIRMPNLDVQTSQAGKSHCSEDEQVEIKNKFIEDANDIGREFLKKMKK
ncbi:hypothetical protein I2I11_16955 [Pontibacter sp. 172403-2]|uniref:hypothetical protein n=1 Tax=Pontibacter rufus TaxID=2791028 RepID=UPI0018AFAD54|nr:hypothetical protein [Pontibacter sp. 172403-2]MBF9254996.1 hypothetical protein [Pontibacter sp. 172403-2]